jgi:hypothetical protein
MLSHRHWAKWLDYDIPGQGRGTDRSGNEHATLKASGRCVAMYAYLTKAKADFGKLRIVTASGSFRMTRTGWYEREIAKRL